jgi:uncharacterized coiled-coil DUF342 family protein
LAIYHCSIKVVGRSKGKSAVRSAAYRAGEKIRNEYDGQIHDYTRKKEIIYKEILLADNAPREYINRSVLWNSIELFEKAKNAQLARDFELALPKELSQEQNISLVLDYVNKYFVSVGMCADVCVHDKGDGNPHAHVMLTMRPININGTWGAKSKKEYILDDNYEKIKFKSGEYKSRKINSTDWNQQTKAEEWRQGWADTVNLHLTEHGIMKRIDHRSYERQGIDKIPSIHLGVAASSMERKGIRTERGDINRRIAVTNSQMKQLKARIRKTKNWLYSVPINETPSMMDMMSKIADSRNLENRWQKIRNIKTQAKILIFLQDNNITDISGLANKIESINKEYKELADTIKSVERRIKQLEIHFEQHEIRINNRSVYNKYVKLDPKKREQYYVKHKTSIDAFIESRDYFTAIMNGRKNPPPIKDWKSEYTKLTDYKAKLCDKYYVLQDEVRNMEQLKKGADNIMRGNTIEEPIKRYSLEL